MVTIFLRSVQKGKGKIREYRLGMRDSNGNEGFNDFRTIVKPGSKVTWELEKKSGIKDIIRIWVDDKNPKGKVFKHEPKKVLTGKKFQVDLVVTDKELEDKYNIKFIVNDGTEVQIDPYIRIKPPSTIG